MGLCPGLTLDIRDYFIGTHVAVLLAARANRHLKVGPGQPARLGRAALVAAQQETAAPGVKPGRALWNASLNPNIAGM